MNKTRGCSLASPSSRCSTRRDPEEGFSYAKMAFNISEALELPVILNSTPRLGHTSRPIEVGRLDKHAHREPRFVDDKPRWICVAALALERHRWLNTRLREAPARLESYPLVERAFGGSRLRIVTKGVAHNYVIEAVQQLKLEDDVSVLKLGMSFPLPAEAVTAFAAEVDEILVVEELEPFVEDQLRTTLQIAGQSTRVRGKHESLFPLEGEAAPFARCRGAAAGPGNEGIEAGPRTRRDSSAPADLLPGMSASQYLTTGSTLRRRG